MLCLGRVTRRRIRRGGSSLILRCIIPCDFPLKEVFNAHRASIKLPSARQIEFSIRIRRCWIIGKVTRSTEVFACHTHRRVDGIVGVVCNRAFVLILLHGLAVKGRSHAYTFFRVLALGDINRRPGINGRPCALPAHRSREVVGWARKLRAVGRVD